MKLLRTLPTRRLLFLLSAGGLLAIAALTAAVAIAGGGSPPPPEPLTQALHNALTADRPSSVSARIKFTNGLVPGSALGEGHFGSPLLTGATGRLWVTGDGRGRIELQSDAGDAQIVWNGDQVTVYDASSNTVYRATLPARHDAGSGTEAAKTPPSVAEIQDALNRLAVHADVSGATPTDVAGEPAYSVRIEPKDHSSLLGRAELAWDALNGVPLRVGIYAKGAGSPVLQLAVTDITFGGVSDGDVSISPPAGATVVDLSPPSGHDSSSGDTNSQSIEGLAAVKAAANFPVTFPDSVAGRARTAVRLVGSGDSQVAVAVYGENLGAIAVVERKAAADHAGPLGSLPTVNVGGHSAHELATPLATILEWQRDGVSTIVAGSVTPAVAESAAADVG